MTYFNPLVAPLAGSPQAQRAAAADKERVARVQALAKDAAAQGDRFEHQVESTDAVSPAGDALSGAGQQRRPPHHRRAPREGPVPDESGDAHIDVKG